MWSLTFLGSAFSDDNVHNDHCRIIATNKRLCLQWWDRYRFPSFLFTSLTHFSFHDILVQTETTIQFLIQRSPL